MGLTDLDLDVDVHVNDIVCWIFSVFFYIFHLTNYKYSTILQRRYDEKQDIISAPLQEHEKTSIA